MYNKHQNLCCHDLQYLSMTPSVAWTFRARSRRQAFEPTLHAELRLLVHRWVCCKVVFTGKVLQQDPSFPDAGVAQNGHKNDQNDQKCAFSPETHLSVRVWMEVFLSSSEVGIFWCLKMSMRVLGVWTIYTVKWVVVVFLNETWYFNNMLTKHIFEVVFPWFKANVMALMGAIYECIGSWVWKCQKWLGI